MYFVIVAVSVIEIHAVLIIILLLMIIYNDHIGKSVYNEQQ